MHVDLTRTYPAVMRQKFKRDYLKLAGRRDVKPTKLELPRSTEALLKHHLGLAATSVSQV